MGDAVTTDRLLAFHRPRGMSCSHYRALIRERVAFANRFHCTCADGCQPEQQEGRRCWLSGFNVPVGYFTNRATPPSNSQGD
jgi:hypothetical protein